ncbi:hypothetical protein [Cellulomonas sp. URHB0016]
MVVVISSIAAGATPLGDTVMSKICQAFGATCAAPGVLDASSNPEPERECTVRTDGQDLEFGLDFLVLSIGESGEIAVETMSDETYKVTVGGEIGASYAFDPIGKVLISGHRNGYGGSLGAQAEASVGGFVGAGSEFSFDSKEEVDAFTDYVRRTAAKAAVNSAAPDRVGGPVAPVVGLGIHLGTALYDTVTGYDYKPPAADASYFEGGVIADGSAVGGVVALGAGASAQYQDALGFKVDHETGDTTIYSRVTLDLAVASQLGFSTSHPDWGEGVDLAGNIELMLASTVDKDGNLTSLSLDGAATSEGSVSLTALTGVPLQVEGGKGVQLSATVPVTDANRAPMIAALASLGVRSASAQNPVQGVVKAAIEGRTAAAIEILSQARRSGDVTAQFLDVSSSSLADAAISIEAPVIGGVGGSFGVGTSNRTSAGAHYLGKDGWKDWTACA